MIFRLPPTSLGQLFMPSLHAEFMASLFQSMTEIRRLDAGDLRNPHPLSKLPSPSHWDVARQSELDGPLGISALSVEVEVPLVATTDNTQAVLALSIPIANHGPITNQSKADGSFSIEAVAIAVEIPITASKDADCVFAISVPITGDRRISGQPERQVFVRGLIPDRAEQSSRSLPPSGQTTAGSGWLGRVRSGTTPGGTV